MTPDALLNIRKGRNETRGEFAAWLGVSASAVVHWEGGARAIPDWVEERCLRNATVSLPLEDLILLLNYAAEQRVPFDTILSQAIRDHLKAHAKDNVVRPPDFNDTTLEERARVAEEPTAYKPREKPAV